MSESLRFRRIALLPDGLVNQIAAGEVIERPASVVKELIENCIDANATRIEIHAHAGGTEQILVRDNGSGIHPEDMPLAVMRHSTSKLGSIEELARIRSMGFRGEALSSIASVSDFCLISRIAESEHGWQMNYQARTLNQHIVPAAHPVGTTVQVDNLFQAVPARRKFLRSEKTEYLAILEIVKRLVLSQFDIDINLYHNGKLILSCPAVESDYAQRIKTVMGSSFYKHAYKVDTRIEHMRLWGWLGGAEVARNQSDRQYLYLNHRVIRDRQLTHAIRLAFDDLIPASRYPGYILHLQMDPETVDVNVHPTKQEVRFRQPRNVHDFVHAVLREYLQQQSYLPVGKEYDRTDTGRGLQHFAIAYRGPGLNESAPAYFSSGIPDPAIEIDQCDPFGTPLTIVHGRYILTAHEHQLRIIDYINLKHEYLCSQFQQEITGNTVKQRPLLVPVMLKLTDSETRTLISNQSLLANMGLELEQSGPVSIMLRTFPAILPDLDLKSALTEITTRLSTPGSTPECMQQDILRIMVKHAVTSAEEGTSFREIREDLRKIAKSGFPVADRQYRNLWQTLGITDIERMLDNVK